VTDYLIHERSRSEYVSRACWSGFAETGESSDASILTIDSSPRSDCEKRPPCGYGTPPNRQVLYCWRLLWLSTGVIEKIAGLFAPVSAGGLVLFGQLGRQAILETWHRLEIASSSPSSSTRGSDHDSARSPSVFPRTIRAKRRKKRPPTSRRDPSGISGNWAIQRGPRRA